MGLYKNNFKGDRSRCQIEVPDRCVTETGTKPQLSEFKAEIHLLKVIKDLKYFKINKNVLARKDNSPTERKFR